MATQAVLTLDQFLALPEAEDGTHYELSEGELITLPPPGFRYGFVAANVVRILGVTLDLKKYVITTCDTGFLLKTDPNSATLRGADVAVNLRSDISELPETYLSQAPLLAVEVVSPGNSAPDIERKVNEYLSAGSLEVCLLYPETRRLYVFHPHGEVRVFQTSERFRSVLGAEFAVAAFFGD